jgi:imidazole glycerol-phosphate synthase subunit HisF
MTSLRRVIVCLDATDGRVVKGVRFRGLRDVGDPALLAVGYESAGADEIVLLDITATAERREARWDTVQRTAEGLFIPLTVGGGIRSLSDISQALQSGADKVAINSAAVARPALIQEASVAFGAQCVVASIDALPDGRMSSGWKVVTHGGRATTPLDVVAWASECAERGAGEILLTSIERDGTRQGYDVALTGAVAQRVSIPVIASGGAGGSRDVCAVFTDGAADAALVAGILHEGMTTVQELKDALAARGIPVRQLEGSPVAFGTRA